MAYKNQVHKWAKLLPLNGYRSKQLTNFTDALELLVVAIITS